MEQEQAKKPTPRPKRMGSVFKYKNSAFWWIAWQGWKDGRLQRCFESSESTRKKAAEDLLLTKLGEAQRGVAVVPKAGKLTFAEAAQNVVNRYSTTGKRSLNVVERRIRKHLLPFFGPRRMAGISSAHVVEYVAKRQADTIVTRKARVGEDGAEVPALTKPVSNAEINRELQILKMCFNLAIRQGLLLHKPHVEMLRESAPRSGFFEADALASVLAHLPEAIRPVIRFAAITGWRIASEVLGLQWHQVDFDAGEVRLLAGTTKNGDGRVFPMTVELRAILEAQQEAQEAMRRAGRIVPWVFHRDGERIVAFNRSWNTACDASGCPGRIPHDLRRTAVRNLVRAGIPERVAMTMTGHKTASVFQRYNIVSDGDLREAALRLDAAGTVSAQGARKY